VAILYFGIGYPETWLDYAGLEVVRGGAQEVVLLLLQLFEGRDVLEHRHAAQQIALPVVHRRGAGQDRRGTRGDLAGQLALALCDYCARPYAYSVAGREPPGEPLRVELTLPSGAGWTYGPEDAVNRITT